MEVKLPPARNDDRVIPPRERSRGWPALAMIPFVCALQSSPAVARQATTSIVSVNSGGAMGDAPSFSPSISPDGRFVAFTSVAMNLIRGNIIRLGTKMNTGGASHYPSAGDPPISIRGGVTLPGERTYQVWFRNAAAFCTAATFNLTNGVRFTWTL